MMMRRYVDASRTFQDILVFLSKISAVNSLSYQYDQMLKKQEGAGGWFVLGEFFWVGTWKPDSPWKWWFPIRNLLFKGAPIFRRFCCLVSGCFREGIPWNLMIWFRWFIPFEWKWLVDCLTWMSVLKPWFGSFGLWPTNGKQKITIKLSIPLRRENIFSGFVFCWVFLRLLPLGVKNHPF